MFTARYEINLSILSRLDSEKDKPYQAQAVRRQPLTAKARVGSQVNPRDM